MRYCDHGCGRPAKHHSLSTNKWKCEKSSNKCPAVRLRNSLGMKAAYKNKKRDAKLVYKNLSSDTKENMAWSLGLTKDTDERVRKNADALSEYHFQRIKNSNNEKERRQYYRSQCGWAFGNNPNIICNIKGYELLKKLGMYDRHKNTGGVVRDHRYSVYDGFKNNIPAEMIAHPANCEFITQVDNARKTIKSSILKEELFQLVDSWHSPSGEMVDTTS